MSRLVCLDWCLRLSVSRLGVSRLGVSRMCVSGLVNTMDRKMQVRRPLDLPPEDTYLLYM